MNQSSLCDHIHTWKQASRTALSWWYFNRWLLDNTSYSRTDESQEETSRNGAEAGQNLTAEIPSSGDDFNLYSEESAMFSTLICHEIYFCFQEIWRGLKTAVVVIFQSFLFEIFLKPLLANIKHQEHYLINSDGLSEIQSELLDYFGVQQ